ncbi:MAG: hypothetical protein Q8L55_13080, partial [Phycisphaerales bacterium]|nr:hypothetical protein [Phycisphaerales bacterium]
MIDRRELDRLAKKARLASAKRPDLSRVSIVMRDCGCVRCGYNLKTLRFDQVCPECGTPVKRSIIPEDPDAKPWEDAANWRPRWWMNMFGLPAEKVPVVAPILSIPKANTPQPCPRCGYNCAGIPRRSPCPECGTPRADTPAPAGQHVQQAMQALALHAGTGMLFAAGWAACGLALALQWLVFAAGASFADTPWALTGSFLYALAAIASAAASFASFQLVIADPPMEVAAQTATFTRITALAGSLLWSATCGLVAFGCWRDWGSGPVLACHGGFFLASILLSFHCRVMLVIAHMVGRAENAIRSAALGLPFSIVVLLAASSWFVFIGRVPLISFVSCMFITLFA